MKVKLLFFCLCFILLQTNPVLGQEQKKILVVHSYHPEWEWVSTVSNGIKQKLMSEKNILLQFLYMDTKRNDSVEWKDNIGKQIRETVNIWKPDVLLLVDDNAQKYIGTFYLDRYTPKIVFCGVNNNPEDYGYDKANNVTGILERPPFRASLNLLEKINPLAKKIAVITDTSITSKGVMDYIKKDVEVNQENVIGFDMIKTFGEWKNKVKEYQNLVDAIIVYHYYVIKDENTGAHVDPKQVMEWTQKNSQILVLDMSSPDNGAPCGVDNSGFEHGVAAGEIAVELINGAQTSDFSIKIAEKGISFLDVVKVEALGFKIDSTLKEEVDILIEG